MTGHILVVDDEVDTCRNLRDILSDYGYEVDIAHDGPRAIELVRANAYDLALLDLRMPGMDGISVLREIRRIRGDLVTALVTAYAGGAAVSDAIAAGACTVMSKPLDVTRLMTLIDSALARPIALLVDDDRDLCQSLGEVLQERGFRVSVAHDESEALRQVSNRRHDVVLVDLKLPDGDGVRVLKTVRQENSDAAAILITGYREETAGVEESLAAGANEVCYKPFDVPGLLTLIDKLVRERRTS